MTWSLIVHDPATQAFAVAITTCAFAVGARCPHVRAGVGAVATQSMTNPHLGPAILDLLERDVAPAEAIDLALSVDQGAGIRQVHAVNRRGRAAAWTGGNCVEWCGHTTAEGVSVAGNMLAGPAVVAETLAAFQASGAHAHPERMIGALHAGERAGGDKRGRQSAAFVMATRESYPDISLRVDDHTAPLDELSRLLGVWRTQVEPRRHWTPSRDRPSGETDLDAIEAVWIKAGASLRFRR
jgi:uncharacterized Ntn-hydrolase superfamily protein